MKRPHVSLPPVSAVNRAMMGVIGTMPGLVGLIMVVASLAWLFNSPAPFYFVGAFMIGTIASQNYALEIREIKARAAALEHREMHKVQFEHAMREIYVVPEGDRDEQRAKVQAAYMTAMMCGVDRDELDEIAKAFGDPPEDMIG